MRTVESTHPTGAWDLYDCTMSHDFSDNAIIDFTDLDWIGRGGPRSKRTSTPHSASAMRSAGGCGGRIPPFLPRLAAPATREPPIPRRSPTRRRSAARPRGSAAMRRHFAQRSRTSSTRHRPHPRPRPSRASSKEHIRIRRLRRPQPMSASDPASKSDVATPAPTFRETLYALSMSSGRTATSVISPS